MTLSNGKSIELNSITESGNGYIRFSDGTQICYGFNVVPNPGKKIHRIEYSFAYPKTFSDVPICSVIRQACNIKTDNLDINLIDKDFSIDRITSNDSTCVFDVIYTQGEADFGIINTTYIAIGRWK